MKTNQFYTIYFTLILSVLLSCKTEIEMEFPEFERKLVVNSLFCPDSLFKVNITSNATLYESQNKIEFIDYARIELYENEEFIELLEYKGNGNYISDTFYPSENNTYSVIVSATGMETVTANSYIPEHVEITDIDTQRMISNVFGYEQLLCNLTFKDPEVENYYYFFVRTYNYGYYNIPSYTLTNDELADRWGFTDNFLYPFTDKIFNNETYQLKIEIGSNWQNSNEQFCFFLCNVSKDFYLFVNSVIQKGETNEVFSDPVQLYSNIENGIGIFGGYTISKNSIIFE